MTGRGGKRRGRPPKTQTMDRQQHKFQYNLMKKPKYLTKESDSQFSTPSVSRASSPQGSEGSRRSRPSTSRKSSGRGGRGRRRGGGNHSVKGAYSKRSYEMEYHYGSDFGDSSDDNEPDDDLLSSSNDSDSLIDDNDNNDSDFSYSSFSNESGVQKRNNRMPSPDPLWLQARDLPQLILPNSSDDLLIPKQYSLRTASIYEVFRRFKNLVRLTPFRLEDFCAALMSDEQSSLLSEIHMMLLKALLREDDSQQTHFGPQDHKDSINISLHLIDQMSWPEVLKNYLESDDSFDKSVLQILATKDYPYVGIEERLSVLQFLTDQFLTTTVVRDDLMREGPIHYDDHCRICHKLGDLLCCETCPAVFHLDCVDPPLETIPTGDYQCNLCKAQQVEGVYDCISTQEKQGFLCRQEHLGYDRHGRKYWFINRRIFVEAEESGEIWYYSSVPQFEQLLSTLDEEEMELPLCREIFDYKDEIIRQMNITEAITNKNKGSKKSYLEVENQAIANKIKKEKETAAALENGTADTSSDEKSAEENGKADDANESKTEHASEIEKETSETNASATPVINKNVVSTRLKTGSLTPRNYSTDDLKRKNSVPLTKDDQDNERLTRHKLNQITNDTLLFKLGMENSFKSYVNQFTTNTYALNKPQRKEERDKKQSLAHKFSINTTTPEFKWIGITNGNHSEYIETLRKTCLSLEQAIVTPFMHPHWSSLRKLWIRAIAQCNEPTDFAKALIIIQACMKYPVFKKVWHEHLGHTKLHRVTLAEREEKKKQEKREKREREDEEERNRLAINFVKNSLGLKHQLAKQKGEEYRIHGQWSWIWMSYGRRQHKGNSQAGERIRPKKILTKVRHNDVEKIISLDAATYEYLKNYKDKGPDEEAEVVSELENTEIVPIINSFDVLDVSSALTTKNRLLYPKIASSSVLDSLLERRTRLKSAEEQKIARAIAGANADEPTAHKIAKPTPRELTDAEKQLQKIVGIRTTNVDENMIKSIAKSILAARDRFTKLTRLGKQYKCYAKCDINSDTFSLDKVKKTHCYSPMCLQKARAKENLVMWLHKAYVAGDKDTSQAIMNIVNKKPQGQKLGDNKGNVAEVVEDPIKLRDNLLTALGRGVLGNEDIDINRHIIIKEDKVKEENEVNGDQIKIEETTPSESNVEEVESKVDAVVEEPNPIEDTAPENTNSVEKMDVDGESNDDKQNNLSDSANDVDVTSNNDDTSVTVENNDSNEKDGILNNDESSRERRSSRRSIKNRTSIRTTTTTTKTTTKYSDGSEEHETNSLTKTRTKDVKYDNRKTSTHIAASTTADSTKVVYRPNRRFAVTSKSVKREDTLEIKKEYAADGSERVYSVTSTRGKVYLAKVTGRDDMIRLAKPETVASQKYPSIGNFLTKKGMRSIMVLQNFELKKLARTAGKHIVSGFNDTIKTNVPIWPYPCSRPLFKTCWLYRTMNVKTLAAVASQLRILWSCLRWDDMAVKPPTSDGKYQKTTDTEIVTEEILKHKICGRFSEKTQYLRRQVVIPLEVPRMIREFTPIRSGLRKRKRAESPQKTETQVSEEWVDEDKLELWEIKMFGEKLERQPLMQPITRTSTGKLPSQRVPAGPSTPLSTQGKLTTPTINSKQIVSGQNATAEELKEQFEQQLRSQRALQHQKRALEQKNRASTSKDNVVNAEESPKTPLIAQRRKIIIRSADGTKHQVTSPGQLVKSSSNAGTPVNVQKVQIIRTADGKISYRGLQPNQRLIRMPDGTMHIWTKTENSGAGSSGNVAVLKTATPKTITKITTNQSESGTPGVQKTPVIIRQQIAKGNPTNVVVKSVTPKTVGTQKVILNNSPLITSTPQSKAQVATNAANTQKLKQLIVPNASSTPKVVNAANLQQLLTQGSLSGQKVLINQANSGGKIILSTSSPQSQSTQSQAVTQQAAIIQNATGQQPQVIVSQPGQKLVQQFVNSSNQQQQIFFGNQRIVLNPGQRIIAQQQQPQTAQIIQQISQPQLVQTVQQPQQQQQQQIILQRPAQAVNQVQIIQQASQVAHSTAPATQQVIVNNSNLAQQLSQGKLHVASVNGQQVIIKPIGNNQVQIVAHIKTQVNGQSHIVTSQQLATSSEQSAVESIQTQVIQQKQTQPQAIQQPKLIIQSKPAAIQPVRTIISTQMQATNQSQQQLQQVISPEQKLVQTTPPGTKCVTAQVIKTANGQQIVLRGVQSNELTPHQLDLVNQQVKEQLQRAQALSGKQGVLGPIKIYLKLHSDQNQNAQPPPLTPVQAKSEIVPNTQVPNSETIAAPSSIVDNDGKIFINGSEISQEQPVTVSKIEVIENTANMSSSDASTVAATPTTKSAITDAQVQQHEIDALIAGEAIDDDSFIVTPDYIQQTIKNALKQENLNPEIEEKLLNLQRFQEKQMKSDQQPTSIALAHNHHEYSSPTKQASTSRKRPASRTQDDEEWILETPKRRPPRASSLSEKKGVQSTAVAAAVALNIENDVNRIIRSVEEETAAIKEKESPEQLHTPQKSFNNRRTVVIKRESEKKKQQQQLQMKLHRQKENLKKDILKKRIVLEKELQIEIQKELATELASRTKRERKKTEEVTPVVETPTKKRANTASTSKQSTENIKSTKANSTANETPRKSSGAVRRKPHRASSSAAKKKEKLYCICRTPYDDSKFYVGCDLCNNWFHGECVNITEDESKDLSEFICSECKHARDTQELYCLCRQPYDETQFYICCDKCQDWFHGRCVGILQSEAEGIDEYICPNCQRNNSVNFANMKEMGTQEYDNLRKLIKQIQSHKSAWPFMEPVDRNEAPDYYVLIKDPMDLQKIETKINNKSYNKLSEFIADMTKIFDNCRFYNSKESPFYRCAESLEGFFVQKIKYFRESLVENKLPN